MIKIVSHLCCVWRQQRHRERRSNRLKITEEEGRRAVKILCSPNLFNQVKIITLISNINILRKGLRFEDLTEVVMKNPIFWDMPQCIPLT
jgi:hypothetical protein